VRTLVKSAVCGLLLLLTAASAQFFLSVQRSAAVQAADARAGAGKPLVVFASLGRIEGLSETTMVGAAADGILKAVYVQEDEFVTKGTPLGEIACDDLKPLLQSANADAEAARQDKARLLRGTRTEERRVANKKSAAARATFEEANSNLHRQRMLFEAGQLARAAYEQAVRDLGIARANLQAAVRTEQLLAAPPLPEDKARADAEILAAEGRLQSVQERLKKCSVLAPIDGTILRVYAKAGESFSTVAPRPLFSIADATGRRVKAEVDERDLGKIKVGQKVIVLADGLPDRKFFGTVSKISAVMGRKSVFTADPSEKVDRDVVEATITFTQNTQALPIGLRVTVQFLSE
jgi:HlyD family secretion protein